MDQELTGKVVVVTGASRGIGLAIVRALVAEGALVVAGVRTSNAALEALRRGTVVTGDLSTPDGPGLLVEAAVAAHGRLDVLVNNIGGVRPRLDGFAAVTDDDWLWAFATNLMPAVRATRAALPHLLASAPSSIVTISSVNATLPDPAVIDYSAAKAALTSFSKSLSREVGPLGVRVNTISPGPVATDLWLGGGGVAETIAARTGHTPEEIAAGAAADSATGRFTRPDEVADLVVLLAGRPRLERDRHRHPHRRRARHHPVTGRSTPRGDHHARTDSRHAPRGVVRTLATAVLLCFAAAFTMGTASAHGPGARPSRRSSSCTARSPTRRAGRR